MPALLSSGSDDMIQIPDDEKNTELVKKLRTGPWGFYSHTF